MPISRTVSRVAEPVVNTGPSWGLTVARTTLLERLRAGVVHRATAGGDAR